MASFLKERRIGYAKFIVSALNVLMCLYREML